MNRMLKTKIKLLDYFFVLRPTLFFPVWTVFLANHHANSYFDQIPSPRDPLIVGFLLTILMGSAFIINQLKDVETDRKNEKLFIIANGYISRKHALIEAMTLLLVALVIGFYIDRAIGIIFSAIFLTTGIMYNLKPFEWKNKPCLGILANFLGGLTVASAGWIAAGMYSYRFILHGLPYALGLVAVYFLTTLADRDGDMLINKVTFGVKYGIQWSLYFALFFEIVTIVVSYLLGDFILFIPALISLPFFIVASVTRRLSNILRTVKFTVLFASMAVCIVYPSYFILLLIVYFFSKWYYKYRFGLEYPRFAA